MSRKVTDSQEAGASGTDGISKGTKGENQTGPSGQAQKCLESNSQDTLYSVRSSYWGRRNEWKAPGATAVPKTNVGQRWVRKNQKQPVQETGRVPLTQVRKVPRDSPSFKAGGFSRSCMPRAAALKYNCSRAINSVGECHLHTVEVTGSNPVSPICDPLLEKN